MGCLERGHGLRPTGQFLRLAGCGRRGEVGAEWSNAVANRRDTGEQVLGGVPVDAAGLVGAHLESLGATACALVTGDVVAAGIGRASAAAGALLVSGAAGGLGRRRWDGRGLVEVLGQA